jgi:hypothetical protein
MDPFRFERRGLRPDAIGAFVVGVIVAYVVQVSLRFGGGSIFQTLVVVAIGGLWYHWRKVV